VRALFVAASLAAAAAGGFVLAGCGGSSGAYTTTTTMEQTTTSETTTTAPTTTAQTKTIPLAVYFLRDGKVGVARRDVPETKAVATAALTALIAGPNHAEGSAGLSSALSAEQEFHDLRVDGGVASVTLPGNLTREAQAQVVYTLTQFSSVRAVDLGGKAVGRGDFEDLTPAILVETPAPDETISSPVRIRGTANTFEATFVVKLTVAGRKLFEQPVTATSGSGTRGTFDVSIPFDAGSGGPGALVAFEESAENGQPVNVVQMPVLVR
jgi:germination protein M